METLLNDLREYWSVDEARVAKLVAVDCNRVLDRALAHLETAISESGAVASLKSLHGFMLSASREGDGWKSL